MEYRISPEKTAISNGVSRSCKELVDGYIGGKVLDYGFGKLRNAKYMLEKGLYVDILDTKIQIQNNREVIKSMSFNCIYNSEDRIPANKYERVLLSFVLNVIPEIKNRVKILRNINRGLKENGLLYIEVRNPSFVKNLKNTIKHNDGLLTGNTSNKTFQKPYTLEDISRFVNENGFEVLDSMKTSGSIILVCSKK